MSDAPSLVVVTGLSGASKSTALRALSDIGYYCVDNLPPTLAAETVRVCSSGGVASVALGLDVRVGAFLDAAFDAIDTVRRTPKSAVLFLTASDDALVRRFSETRRPHPMLSGTIGGPGVGAKSLSELPVARAPLAVLDGVRLERQRMAAIGSLATHTVDTTHMSVHELRRDVVAAFTTPEGRARMVTRIMSFGFKHGVPLDADLVFDVRFLENPHFVEELRAKSGMDAEVRDYVLASDGAAELLERLDGLLSFALPRYEKEGKSYLTVALGCTGGRHRSVALAHELSQRLSHSEGRRIGFVHRDVARGGMMTSSVAKSGAAGHASQPPPETDGAGR